MEDFTKKTAQTRPYDLTYCYYLSPNFHAEVEKGKPVLMLVHGFPDEAWMWSGAVHHLRKLGYPMLIPDLLGFAGSSKTTEVRCYNYKQQADSLGQILDRENVPSRKAVIPIGHDWGSATCQRFYLYHRERCLGLGLISLAYQVPSSELFDLGEANTATAKSLGYPQWEYWNFFTSSDAPQVMAANIDRFYAVNHGNFLSPEPEEKGRDIWMRKMFCTPGAMRAYVSGTGEYAGYTVPLKPYAEDPDLQKRFRDRMLRDGLAGPVCYYHALNENSNLDDERPLCQVEGQDDKRRIDVPVLYIGQTGDWVCRTDQMSGPKDQGLVPDLEEHATESGHWTLYEKPGENADIIANWLKRRFPLSAA